MSDDIVGYLLDTLEIQEQQEIDERIARDPAFRAEVELHRAIIAPLASDDKIAPPEGLASRALQSIRGRSIAPQPSDEAYSGNTSRLRPVDFVLAVSILGIAATLVIPAIASVRGDQARLLCADKLRRIGEAILKYSSQENNYIPYISPNGPTNNAGSFAMVLQEMELLDNQQTLLCPSSNNGVVMLPRLDAYLKERVNDPVEVAKVRRYMSGSYGYTLGYIEHGKHLGYRLNADRTMAIVSDRPPRRDDDKDFHFVNSPNHADRGQNVFFSDGSVRWLPDRVYGKDDIFSNHLSNVEAGIQRSDCVIGVSESVPYSPASASLGL